jgi:hypothetical protein
MSTWDVENGWWRNGGNHYLVISLSIFPVIVQKDTVQRGILYSSPCQCGVCGDEDEQGSPSLCAVFCVNVVLSKLLWAICIVLFMFSLWWFWDILSCFMRYCHDIYRFLPPITIYYHLEPPRKLPPMNYHLPQSTEFSRARPPAGATPSSSYGFPSVSASSKRPRPDKRWSAPSPGLGRATQQISG